MPPRNRLLVQRYGYVSGGLQLGAQPEDRQAPSFVAFAPAIPSLPDPLVSLLPFVLAPQQAKWAYDGAEHFANAGTHITAAMLATSLPP